jgi:hypothetical protein
MTGDRIGREFVVVHSSWSPRRAQNYLTRRRRCTFGRAPRDSRRCGAQGSCLGGGTHRRARGV